MKKKLTLSIDKNVIKRAKQVSKQKSKSLSKMVEEYLIAISDKEVEKTSSVEKLSGILNGKITNPEVVWKKEKT